MAGAWVWRAWGVIRQLSPDYVGGACCTPALLKALDVSKAVNCITAPTPRSPSTLRCSPHPTGAPDVLRVLLPGVHHVPAV